MTAHFRIGKRVGGPSPPGMLGAACICSIVAATAGAFLAAEGPAPGITAEGFEIEREVVLSLAPGEQWLHVEPGPGLERWAAVTTFDAVGPGTGGDGEDVLGASRVWVDGKLVGLHGYVPPSSIAFEPGAGKGYAFASIAWRKDGTGTYRILRDGEPTGDKAVYTEAVEVSGSLGPWYSPEGKRLAWLGSWKSKQYVVVDGKVKKATAHDAVAMRLPWTADGRLAVVATDGGKDTLIVEGGIAAAADGIRILARRPAASLAKWPLAWIERNGGVESLHLGEESIGGWDEIGEVAFCGQGEGVAWEGRVGGKSKVLVRTAGNAAQSAPFIGEQAAGEWDDVSAIAFSDDCALMAFVARDGQGWRLVAGGQAGRAWKRIESLSFAVDERLMAVASDGTRRIVLMGVAGKDGWTQIGSYQHVARILTGPAGRFAMSVIEAGRAGVVLDGGWSGPEADEVKHCSMTFGEAGGGFATVVRKDGQDVVLLDGGVVGEWDEVVCPLEFRDGELILLARSGHILERVSVAR